MKEKPYSMARVQEYHDEVKELNDKLTSSVPETKQESALKKLLKF